jgi:hypothetical protein
MYLANQTCGFPFSPPLPQELYHGPEWGYCYDQFNKGIEVLCGDNAAAISLFRNLAQYFATALKPSAFLAKPVETPLTAAKAEAINSEAAAPSASSSPAKSAPAASRPPSKPAPTNLQNKFSLLSLDE